MKEAKKMAAQGDIVFRRVDSIPKGAKEVKRENGSLVVTHSESGHHHLVSTPGAELFAHPTDPLLSYLKVPALADSADVVHARPWDTHETLRLLNDSDGEVVWEIRRQKEWIPEGYRQVQD